MGDRLWETVEKCHYGVGLWEIDKVAEVTEGHR